MVEHGQWRQSARSVKTWKHIVTLHWRGHRQLQSISTCMNCCTGSSLYVRVVACPAGGDESHTGDTEDRAKKKQVWQKLIRALSRHRWWSAVSDRTTVNRRNHEERRYRGHGEVPEPGQRQRPAGSEALRGGGAGVRLPCLLLRVDSEWKGSALWALLHKVTSYLSDTTEGTPPWLLASGWCFLLD